MEILYHIQEGAQDFMESPLIIRRGADVILHYDYEQEDGRYLPAGKGDETYLYLPVVRILLLGECGI